MRARRKRLFCLVAIALVGLICVVVWILSHRDPVRPKTERVSEKVHTSTPALADLGYSAGSVSLAKARAEVRRRFGVLVWPGMGARALNYSRSILSWMEEWGFQCGFLKTQATAGNEASSPLPADVTDGAWNLAEVSKNLNSIVLADGDLPPAEVAGVKKYLLSGGWAILPSPENGHASKEVEELLQLTPSRAATLMAPESPQSVSPLGAEEVRLLVSHSLAPGVAPDQWVEWAGPPGTVLYARRDEALPLLCFRRPELPAVRLVPFEDGGVVHWNFPLRPGPLIEDAELKTFLGDTLAWLFARANWPEPTQKEGSLTGIVREKEGSAISGAKVTAQIYSEWGQPIQSLEVPSSQGGEFTLPVVEPAIYWVKAEAEGYYQVDSYLLARPVQGDSPQIEVLMEPQAAIYGHAYYGPGEDRPAGGVPVTLAPNCRISSAWGSETVTDSEGRFSFDDLPSAQTFYLIAKTEGWLGLQEVALPLDKASLEVNIHLQTPFTVEGTTANAVAEEPLPGVEITASPRPSEHSRFLFADALAQDTVSSGEGKFTLALPPGSWSLIARADGFHPVSKSGVWVSPDGETRPSELVLEFCPLVRFHGTVFRSSGEPAPYAKVTVRPETVCQADQHGRYESEPAPPSLIQPRGEILFHFDAEWEEARGGYLLLCRVLKGKDARTVGPWIKSYSELLEGALPVNIHLRERESETHGGALSGIVLDPSGKPSAWTKVELAQPSVHRAESGLLITVVKSSSSASDGTFGFSSVPGGFWLIRARKKSTSPEGYKELLWGEEWAMVDDSTALSPLEIGLANGHIRGRVWENDGTAMRNRSVRFELTLHTGREERMEFFLGEDGSFFLSPSVWAALTRPPKEKYKRWLKTKGKKVDSLPWEKQELPPEGFASITMTVGYGLPKSRRVRLGNVKWGEESLTVAFGPEGSLRGRVVDADTRQPVSRARVSALPGGRYAAFSFSDSEGAFSFPKLSTGQCTLVATKREDGYWSRRCQVEISQGREAYIEVDIWKTFTVRGRLLLRETGQPLVGAEIHTDEGTYTTDHRGRFVIPAPASKDVITRLYWFSVLVQGTGLKSISIRKAVEYSPWEREVDVGGIYVERENGDGGEDQKR